MAKITIGTQNAGSAQARIAFEDPGLSVDYVTTDGTMQQLYIYARRSRGMETEQLERVSLDGDDLENAVLYGPDFSGGVALAVAQLSRPLEVGDYHVIGVETERGRRVDAQFRVLPFVFPRSSIHTPPQLLEPMHMNLAMWQQDIGVCYKYDIDTITGFDFRINERVRFLIGPDEPDAHDQTWVQKNGGAYGGGLGFKARKLMHSGWQEFARNLTPWAPTWIIINGTTKPLNWTVYGQLADISCTDPYPIAFFGADHTFVRESLDLARRCGAPRRMYACLETFGLEKPNRAPTTREYRQNVVQAIGTGMKGLTSWTFVGGAAGGWETREALAKEIGKLNAMIGLIEDDLLLGTPVDLTSNDGGQVLTGPYRTPAGEEQQPKDRVWVGSLLCGPDTIVIAAANHIPASKPDLPKMEPARNITISVRLPEFIRSVKAYEVTGSAVSPFRCTIADGTALLKLDSVESGRVFILRRQ